MKSFSEKLTRMANENAMLNEETEALKDQLVTWIEGMPLG